MVRSGSPFPEWLHLSTDSTDVDNLAIRNDGASPWGLRDFRLVWVGGFVNNIGDWLLKIALPVYVYIETGSGTATAVLFAVELIVAVVLGPLGGSLVDRWDLRRTLIATNLAQAVALLPLIAVTADRVWPAIVVTTVQSALAQLNNPANAALLPRIVPTEHLTVANAANSTSSSLARMVGAPLGGIVVGLGGLTSVVVVDGLTFLAVAVATMMVRAQTAPIGDSFVLGQGDGGGVRAGFRVIRRHRPLPALLGIVALGQLAQGFFLVLFVVFVIDRLRGTATDVGLIRGTMAIGAIVSAIAITKWARRADAGRLLGYGYLGMGIASLLFWNAPEVTIALWLYLVLFAISGLPGAALEIGLMTTVQQRSPPEALGRVVGTLGACAAAGSALGSLLVGALVDHVRLAVLLQIEASIYIVCGALALVVRGKQGDDSADR